jgi:hypothetical protein
MNLTMGLFLVAVLANFMLVGASLDQSLKQLPARNRIGAVAFSAYSRASDLWHGVAWYGALGVGAALLTLAAAIVGLRDELGDEQRNGALVVAAILTIAHSLVTARAAPTNFSQRTVARDKRALTAVFDRFDRLQTLRATLQVLTLVAISWALIAAMP